ncbi:hypothetical protein HMPREF9418_0013 [Neisseria macacae ATCC 33926]|uniref:Uncharacterized protein n=1 Tax=Neisseria macacae ATCC 33926 TaxID=997348 RepID=A0AA36UMB0_9NEIS|nr:hypothetical protein HMPREF9418_0013 [Neisseria macacae ATCC 33926]
MYQALHYTTTIKKFSRKILGLPQIIYRYPTDLRFTQSIAILF